jgi:hypothetical protein
MTSLNSEILILPPAMYSTLSLLAISSYLQISIKKEEASIQCFKCLKKVTHIGKCINIKRTHIGKCLSSARIALFSLMSYLSK